MREMLFIHVVVYHHFLLVDEMNIYRNAPSYNTVTYGIAME